MFNDKTMFTHCEQTYFYEQTLIYVSHNGKLSLLTVDHIAHTGYGRTALTMLWA